VAVAGQVVDLQPDQGAFDDRQGGVVVDPAGAAVSRGWARFQPVAVAAP
jgi:hypothetical protein